MNIDLVNLLRDGMVFRVGAATAANGASWVVSPPESLNTQRNHPGSYETEANLPSGSSVGFTYKRTNVPQQPQVHIVIRNNGGAIQVTNQPTHAAQLSAEVKQTAREVTIRFQGQ